MRRPKAALLSVLGCFFVLFAFAASRSFTRSAPPKEPPRKTSSSAGETEAHSQSDGRLEAPPPHPARWLSFGGGADPSSNQVSMESDLALASEAFGPGGVLLFAGGPRSSGVYELDADAEVDPLIAELAALFAPRSGRDGHYRRTVLRPHGPATKVELLRTLDRELSVTAAPLLAYVDCHGDGAAAPADNSLATWGGAPLTVRELASHLDVARRPVRLVVSACFSGGFADLAFRGAEARQGPTDKDRCGLFASTWDLEATGCDPDPDRRHHEGYAVHFLNALRGRDRDGRPHRVDLDGDGATSLAEAHAAARIASAGLDVPTSTSERWLRHAAPDKGPLAPLELAEEDAVIAALSSKLALSGDLETRLVRARARLDALEARHERLQAEGARTEEELAEHHEQLTGELLARWPTIDDPWHPDHAALLATSRGDIERYLSQSLSFAKYQDAQAAAEKAADAELDSALARAPVERLVRALENVLLAGRLKHRGGSDWTRYVQFLECERTALR